MSITFQRPEYADADRYPLLKHVPDKVQRILDVGCSQGAFGNALKQLRNVEIWGVEPSLEAASVAKERLDHVVNDIYHERNPIPDNYFDLVTFNDSLEHMEDPAEALNLAKRKLRNGGKVHCCIPNIRHVDNLEHLLFERDWRYEDFGIRDRTHLRFFTEKSIARLLSNTGFNVLSLIGINEDWWHEKKRLRRLLFKLFPEFTRDMRYIQFLVIAEPKVDSETIVDRK